MLRGKKILLGITGGIAAYKTTFLTRLLIKAGAQVKVILTPSASAFVTPLTLATLSKNAAHTDFINKTDGTLDWNNHVELGLWADYMLIAPATANSMAKMAQGNCDNLLMATYLSAKCPVFVAPAMDLDMYKHPSTKNTLKKLSQIGNVIIPAEKGELASGLAGEGRMAEPENIIKALEQYLTKNMPLNGKKVLVTAGPTREPIDPVRFLSNRSTGTMGCQLALHAANLGAQVTLVLGPGAVKVQHSAITTLNVVTAQEMYNAVHKHFKDNHIFISAAAVADYTPVTVANEKIKKTGDSGLEIQLKKTKDILKSVGQLKTSQFLVGFALETQDELANATAKLKAKNLDAIVLNSLKDPGAGFGTTTNKVSYINKNLEVKPFTLQTKSKVAADIWAQILIDLNA